MSQDTRKKLLEGAQKCLVQEGFRKTSVKAIARYAGVNHGLVHHYFGSKEELLAALVQAVANGESRPFSSGANVVMPPTGEVSVLGSEEIETFAKKKLVPHLTSDYNKFVMEMLIMSAEMPLVAEQIRTLLNKRREWFGQLLGIHDPGLLLLITGALMGLMLQYKLDSSIDLEKAVTKLFRMIYQNK
jgi:AcrR family transcriptional regulator